MGMDPRGRMLGILLALELLGRSVAWFATPYTNDTAFQVIANHGSGPILVAAILILIASIPQWLPGRRGHRRAMIAGFAGHLVGLLFSINVPAAVLAWALIHHTPFSTAFGYLFVIAPIHLMRMVDHGRRIRWTRPSSRQSSQP